MGPKALGLSLENEKGEQRMSLKREASERSSPKRAELTEDPRDLRFRLSPHEETNKITRQIKQILIKRKKAIFKSVEVDFFRS